MSIQARLSVVLRTVSAIGLATVIGCETQQVSQHNDTLKPSRMSAADTALLRASLGMTGPRQTDDQTADDSAPKSATNNSEIDNHDADAAQHGTMIDAPANVRDFAPEDHTAKIDGREIDFRDALEDLGPVGTEWYQHVQTLSDPWMEGRAPGTKGMEYAQAYLEYWMKHVGLEPAFPGPESGEGHGDGESEWSSYAQPFDFANPRPNVKINSQELAINGKELTPDEDFRVAGISGNAGVMAPLAFAGYAIEEGKDGYSSFDDNSDLAGKIALILRYEPLNDEGKSQWSSSRFSRFANITPKITAVVKRGAVGIILVNPPGAVEGKPGFEEPAMSVRWGKRLSMPVVQVSPTVGDQLMKSADPKGASLMDWRKKADAGEIKTAALRDDVKISISADLDVDSRLHTANVGGVLRGKGNLADQWIIIGGHYDHLGYGYVGAMPQNVGKLHPGADDNASGTAGVLVSAEQMIEKYKNADSSANLRSILFMCFSGEEAGLFGSKYYVDHPTISSSNVDLMINMDMIGRLRSNDLYVGGMGTSIEMEAMMTPLVDKSGLTISKGMGGLGPSDHESFFKWGVPVLFFFTGEHKDYHRPTDMGYTVNPAGAVKVIDLLVSIAWEVAGEPSKMTFVQRAGGGEGRPFRSRTRLGIQPAYTAELETGIQVDGVSEGGPAEKGGIQAGDILLTWNGDELSGPRVLADKLGKAQPGDVVHLKVMRGDKEIELQITLQAPDNAE